MGLKANLTAGEIVEQLAYALQFAPIRNVVFMGMGEPLDNYDAVKVRALAHHLHARVRMPPSTTMPLLNRVRSLLICMRACVCPLDNYTAVKTRTWL